MKSKWRMPLGSRIKPILLQLIYNVEEKILAFLGTWRGFNSIILVRVYFFFSFSKLMWNKITNTALLPLSSMLQKNSPPATNLLPLPSI
jgi:hypothetical protein